MAESWLTRHLWSDRAALRRQLVSFVRVGLAATALHYAVLITLVQGLHAHPVPATLLGFCCGGGLSYQLNRRHTYASDRPHREATWRFAIVAAVGFLVTFALMALLVDRWRLPYLPAQVFTTGLVMFWTFGANRLWTFASAEAGGRPAGRRPT